MIGHVSWAWACCNTWLTDPVFLARFVATSLLAGFSVIIDIIIIWFLRRVGLCLGGVMLVNHGFVIFFLSARLPIQHRL